MIASDWETYVRICLGEIQRDDPHYAGYAHLSPAMATATADSDRAWAHIDRFVDLPSRLNAGSQRLSELAFRCVVHCLVGDIASARPLADETVAISRRRATNLSPTLAAMQVIGVCSWAHGPTAAERV